MAPSCVFVRFPSDRIADFKHDLSGLSKYSAKEIGFSTKIDVVEGMFPDGSAIGMLEFGDEQSASAWMSERESDWLGGVDAMVVPVNRPPQPGKQCVHLIDVEMTDKKRMLDEYVPGHLDGLRASGAESDIVATQAVNALRGTRVPEFLVVHAWPDKKTFWTWYNSDEYAKWKKIRHEAAKSSIIVFEFD